MNQQPRAAVILACLTLLAGAPGASAQDAARPADTYNAATGLLARGLDDLAAAEFQSFLDEHPDHELASNARYGLGVAHSRLGHHQEAADALDPLARDDRFGFVVESTLLAARSLMALNQPDEAAELLARTLRRHDDHPLAPQAAALLVESHSREGDPDSVMRAFNEYRETLTGPGLERATYFAALAHLDNDEPREAIGLLGRLESGTTPVAGMARQLLARTLHQTGDLESAASAYRLAKGKAEGAQRAELSLGLAQVLADLSRLDEASAELESIERENLSDDLRWSVELTRGRVASLASDHDAAVRVLEPTLRRAPEALRSEAAYWLARSQSALGQHARAEATLARAISEDSDSPMLPELTYQHGLALGALGRHAEACQVLRELARVQRGTPLAGEALLAAASFAQASGDAALAQELSTEAAGGLTGEAAIDAAFLAAESAYQRQDYANAARAFDQLLQDLPEDHRHAGTARYRLGMAQKHLGNPDEARRTLASLFESDTPDDRFLPALLALGDMAFAAGDWDEAANWLGRYTKLGTEASAWDAAALRLGLAYASAGNRQSAARAMERLVSETPDSAHAPRAWYELGLLQLSLDNPDRARDAFEHAADAPDDEIARHALAQLGALASASGDHAQAAAYFDRAAERAPAEGESTTRLNQARSLVANGSYDEAARVLARLTEATIPPAERAEALALLTIAHARQARHNEAVEASDALVRSLDAVRSLDPSTGASALSDRARSLRALDRPGDAERTLAVLIDLYPDSPLAPSAHLDLAVIAMDAERFDEAVEHCRVLLQDPESLDDTTFEQASYRLGVASRELGDHAGAASVLEALARREPMDRLSASAALIAGESLLTLGNLARASELLQIASISDDPEIAPVALLRLGEAETGLQRWASAEGTYASFLSEHSGDPRAYMALFGRAWAQENQGRHDEAIAGYREVVNAHDGPTAARAQFQIGECLYAQKKHEEAVRELLRVDLVYAYPEWSAAALYEAGRCFEALDRGSDALAQYAQVVERFEDTQWAELARRRQNALRPPTQGG